MADIKKDMRFQCQGLYEELWYKYHVEHTVSEEDFYNWYNNNCKKCIFMNEVCMDGIAII